MPIKFECSDCGETLKVKEEYGGRKIKCPHCTAVIRVPADNEESDEEEVVSRPRSSAAASRSKQSPRSRSRTNDEEEMEELPPTSKKKKKKTSSKSKSGSGGKVPMWAIVAGCSVAGVVLIAGIVFITTKRPAAGANAQVAGAGQAQPVANVVQAQVEGPHPKIRMKFEMPLNWTSEGSIEDNRWPWATMKGNGQVIKFSANRSLAGNAETMTTMGGLDEKMKMSHTMRGTKLQAENTDWVDGQLGVHPGKNGPVVYSDYEYKGVFGKGYGIRCTVLGPVMPCNLMLECGQSARDQWRPTLLAIAESIHFVSIKENGQEERDDFDFGPGDDKVGDAKPGDEKAGADPAEMGEDPEEKPEIN